MKVNVMIFLFTPPMKSIPNHKTAASPKTIRVGVGRWLSMLGMAGKNPASSWMVAATVPQNQAQSSLRTNPYNTAAQTAPAAVPSQPSSGYTISTDATSSRRPSTVFESITRLYCAARMKYSSSPAIMPSTANAAPNLLLPFITSLLELNIGLISAFSSAKSPCHLFAFSLLNDQQDNDECPDYQANRHCHDTIRGDNLAIRGLQDQHDNGMYAKRPNGRRHGELIVFPDYYRGEEDRDHAHYEIVGG